MSYWSAVKGKISDSVTRILRLDSSTHSMQTVGYPHHEVHQGSHFYIEGHITLGAAATNFFKVVTPDSLKWDHMVWTVSGSGIVTATIDEDATGGMAGGEVATIHGNNRNKKCWTGRHTGADDQATVLTDATKSWTPDELIGYQVFNSTDECSGIVTDNDETTVTVAALAGGTGNDWDTDDAFEINASGTVITKGVTTCTAYIQRLAEQKFGSKQIVSIVSREDELVVKQDTVHCFSLTSGTASNIIFHRLSWYEHEDKG